jgi:hypothetical protein
MDAALYASDVYRIARSAGNHLHLNKVRRDTPHTEDGVEPDASAGLGNAKSSASSPTRGTLPTLVHACRHQMDFRLPSAAAIHMFSTLVGAYTIQHSMSCQSKTALCGFLILTCCQDRLDARTSLDTVWR